MRFRTGKNKNSILVYTVEGIRVGHCNEGRSDIIGCQSNQIAKMGTVTLMNSLPR